MSAVWSSSFHHPAGLHVSNQPLLEPEPLSSLLYRSRAIKAFNDLELQQLINAARIRNQAEGLTGLLVYHEGRFLQWLEGPADSLHRVWCSIRNDNRHMDIALLGESSIEVRRFGNSSMALSNQHAGANDLCSDEVAMSPEMFESVFQAPEIRPSALGGFAPRETLYPTTLSQPASLLGDPSRVALTDLLLGAIVPKLVSKHVGVEPTRLVLDPHAPELAHLLVAAHPDEAFALIDSLRADGRSLAKLCAGLFEPTARALGDLWERDDCSELDLTLGLAHLQVALRRINLTAESTDLLLPRPADIPHAVLVAPSPHETHALGSAISSEVFWRAGWDVHCEYPDSDAALSRIVHERWFDVLDLSLSSAFTREHRLPAMAASIRAAHANSLNPAITVIVDGRVFFEQPRAFAQVGADAGSGSALGIVSIAQNESDRRSDKS